MSGNHESMLTAWRRDNMPHNRIGARIGAEDQARQLVMGRLGQLSADDLWEVFSHLDADGDPGTGSRFGLTLARPNYNLMVGDLGVLNDWISRLWTAEESAAPALVDEFGKSRPAKGATGQFASLILYLRAPERFAPWVGPLARAIALERGGGAKELSNYADFNVAAQKMRARFGLLPQELDALSPSAFGEDVVASPSYWWVSQGKTYADGKAHGSIWAPREKAGKHKFYWDNVSKVKRGDVVFHYAEGYLRAVSRAKNDGYRSETPMGGGTWPADRWRTDMDYREFTRPVPIAELGPRIAELRLKNGPVNSSGGANQGYLYSLNEAAVRRILGAIGSDPALAAVGLTAPPRMSVQTMRGAFGDCAPSAGVRVDDLLVTRLLSSLLAKRFLLLTGLSGSGKTKLAQALAVWLAAQPRSEPRYALLAVGANWTSKEDLLGYPDALNAGVFRAKPALELLLRAKEDPKRPYFLILDEMNLSHVERYFSDFLSAMESGEEITLHEGGEWQTEQETPVPEKMVIPANLFVIGTVNVDETTYMFSPKVLDRANVIEFRAEAETVSGFLGSPSEVDLEALAGKGEEFAEAFAAAARMRLGADFELEADVQAALKAELEVFFAVLADHEAEFGFRTAKDVARFVHFFLELSGEQGAGSTEEGTGQADSQLQAPGSERLRRAMDAVVMQKILPKLHGSERKLGPVLRGLGELCHGRDGTPESRLARARAAAENQPEAGSPLAKKPDELSAECRKDEFRQALRYPLSFEKIVRMLRKLRRDGFASFAEA